MKRDFKYWLRWILLIPAALFAGLLADFPLHWILYGTLRSFIDPYPELPEKVLSPFVHASVMVFVGYLIAPEHKMKTAIIIAALWIFGAGVAFAMGFFELNIGGNQLTLSYYGAPVIMGAVGALVGLYVAKNKDNIFDT
jgi:hypothetical protein